MAKKQASLELRREIRKELLRLGLSREKHRVKAVQVPNETFTKAVGSGNYLDASDEYIQGSLDCLKKRCPNLYRVAYLLKEHGLRVSEVLSIRSCDISLAGVISVKGKKRSGNRICSSGLISEYMIECRRFNVDPFRDLDYQYVYREFKKAGIGVKTKNSSLNAVTHAFRHLHIADLKASGMDVEDIAVHMGHKRVINTERYGYKKE